MSAPLLSTPHFCWCPRCHFAASIDPQDVPKFNGERICPDCNQSGELREMFFLKHGPKIPPSINQPSHLPVYEHPEMSAGVAIE